jgi:hypothetical protein
MTAETIAKALGGSKASAGWMACCLAHDDLTEPVNQRRHRWASLGEMLYRLHAVASDRPFRYASKRKERLLGRLFRPLGCAPSICPPKYQMSSFSSMAMILATKRH